jgi:hypothetical protein
LEVVEVTGEKNECFVKDFMTSAAVIVQWMMTTAMAIQINPINLI